MPPTPFDRAVNVLAFDPTAITAQDGVYAGGLFVGSRPATVVSPTTIQVFLEQIGNPAVPRRRTLRHRPEWDRRGRRRRRLGGRHRSRPAVSVKAGRESTRVNANDERRLVDSVFNELASIRVDSRMISHFHR
jgi:hypothetical protein